MNPHLANDRGQGAQCLRLLEELQELASKNAKIKEMLDANNYKKKEINQHNVMVSNLFQKVYLYIKEIDGNLMAVGKMNNANETRFEAIQVDCKELEVFSRRKLDQLKAEKVSILETVDLKKLEMQKNLKEVNGEVDELIDGWETFTREQEAKRNDVEELEAEIERLMRELEEKEVEKRKEIGVIESHITNIYEACHESSKEMDDLKLRIKDAENHLQQDETEGLENVAKKKETSKRKRCLENENSELSTQCLDFEGLIDKSKEEVALVHEEILTEIQKKVELVRLTEKKLLEKNETILCVQNESEQFKLKTEELEAKTSSLKLLLSQQELEIDQLKSAIEHLRQQIVKSDADINFVLRAITEKEKLLLEKETYFNEMQNSYTSELTEIDNKIKTMEEQFQQETNEMQNEVDKVEEQNKNFQQTITELEKKLVDSKLEEVEQILKISEMKEKLDKTILDCNQCETDLKNYNNTKLQQKAVNRREAPIRKPLQPLQRKRPVTFDSDSSSVDGEKLNYFEFQSRRKVLAAKRRKL